MAARCRWSLQRKSVRPRNISTCLNTENCYKKRTCKLVDSKKEPVLLFLCYFKKALAFVHPEDRCVGLIDKNRFATCARVALSDMLRRWLLVQTPSHPVKSCHNELAAWEESLEIFLPARVKIFPNLLILLLLWGNRLFLQWILFSQLKTIVDSYFTTKRFYLQISGCFVFVSDMKFYLFYHSYLKFRKLLLCVLTALFFCIKFYMT